MSQDAYSVKEILTEMKLDLREHHERVLRMEADIKEVLQLAKLTNGRVTKLEGLVATQDIQIQGLKDFKSKAMLLWAAAIFGLQWFLTNVKLW